MTLQEAQQSIGKPFKLSWLRGGIASKFDTILSVDEHGSIIGDFLEAPCEDCRLKEEQPEALKKENK